MSEKRCQRCMEITNEDNCHDGGLCGPCADRLRAKVEAAERVVEVAREMLDPEPAQFGALLSWLERLKTAFAALDAGKEQGA